MSIALKFKLDKQKENYYKIFIDILNIKINTLKK